MRKKTRRNHRHRPRRPSSPHPIADHIPSDFRFRDWDLDAGQDAADKGALLTLDYYQRPFWLFHSELARMGFSPQAPHPIRRDFWSLLPVREYTLLEARPLLLSYMRTLETELAASLSQASLAYWLHVYRRLLPGPIGNDKRPMVVGLTRACMEAAIQKYSSLDPCSRVAVAPTSVPPECVLGGLLAHPDFELERKVLSHRPQLVLTQFTSANLRDFYLSEKLAYEIMRTTALLRTIAKGGTFLVDDSPENMRVLVPHNLSRALEEYDSRSGRTDAEQPEHTSTGVLALLPKGDMRTSGMILVPAYNLDLVEAREFSPFFERAFGTPITGLPDTKLYFNFIWHPYSLRAFLEAHLPFGDAFSLKNGVSLSAVLAVVAAVCHRAFSLSLLTHGGAAIRYWFRAYEGPYDRSFLHDQVADFVPHASAILGLSASPPASDIEAAIHFLTLTPEGRPSIDLAYPGPHHLFLPFGQDRLFLDYAWITRRLYDLFIGVDLPDQAFKGDILERMVRSTPTALPSTPLIANSGETRQIDASFALAHRLIVAECRAVSKSVAFERGEPEATEFRRSKLLKAFHDVDEKAHWLASHPMGRNYDATAYREILPIVVSPFVEFPPAPTNTYRINDTLSRVMTPRELAAHLEDGSLAGPAFNLVQI